MARVLRRVVVIARDGAGKGRLMTTILIVDDEAPIRELLADALMIEGYDVVTVADGLAAFDQIARECPALVITDNMMPRLSGAG